MKKFFKVLLIFVAAMAVGAGGFWAYVNFSQSSEREALTVIPNDAVYIVETSNLTKGWASMSQSKMWKHMINTPFFSDINENVAMFDSLFVEYEILGDMMKNRKLLVSAHMISGVDYDFLFVVDLQKSAKMAFLKEAISYFDVFQVKKRKFKDVEITELIDKETKDVIYLSVIDNLLIVSFVGDLLEKAISEKDNTNWLGNVHFQAVRDNISHNKLFNFYLNYAQLSKFMRVYMDEESEAVKSFSRIMRYSAFNADLQDERVRMEGSTNLDSVSSYLSALAKVKAGKMRAYQVLSNQTAFYLAMCFDSFDDFVQQLENQAKTEMGTEADSYSENIAKVENFLKISLKDDFFSWIGSEIAFVKLRPSQQTRAEDVLVAIQAKNIEAAKTGMNHIMERIRKRSPIKFETVQFNNYEIYYMNMKGFFKAFLGKMFDKLEKPYFTYIEDYLILSNSMEALKEQITDYVNGKTLSRKADFVDFKDDLSVKANLTIFLQMPKLYSNLYYYSGRETRKQIKENKDLILSFSKIGFQMTGDNGFLETTLIAEHDPNALLNDKLEAIENSVSDELANLQFERLEFKIQIADNEAITDGSYTRLFPDSTVQFEGMLSERKLNGIARLFYPSGNLRATFNYKDNMVDGLLTVFYDSPQQTKKAVMTFEEDKIVGNYMEYYDNGARKANIEYDDAKMDGDAEFYYRSGALKVEAGYKDGLKHGKWRYYNEAGDQIGKEKWKKGEKR